jgi:hypothetical protein
VANIYIRADDTVHNLDAHVIKSWHQELVKVNLKIGILFALSARENQPALKENGHPVDGIIKIVPLKDRVTKDFDVEIHLDGEEWKTSPGGCQIALIDHLLTRLEIKKPKKKKKKRSRGTEASVHGTDEERQEHEDAEFITDDIGRPVLKIRKGDWNAGYGFREVVERHGGCAPECRNIDRAKETVEAAMAIYKEDLAQEKAEREAEQQRVTTELHKQAELIDGKVGAIEEMKKVSPDIMTTTVDV